MGQSKEAATKFPVLILDENSDHDVHPDNEMDWMNQSGEAYWDIGIDGMIESVEWKNGPEMLTNQYYCLKTG